MNSSNLLRNWCFTNSVAPVHIYCYLSFSDTSAFSQDFRHMTRRNWPINIDSSTKYFAHDGKRVRDDSLQSIEKWSQHSSQFRESWNKLGSKRSFDRLKDHTLGTWSSKCFSLLACFLRRYEKVHFSIKIFYERFWKIVPVNILLSSTSRCVLCLIKNSNERSIRKDQDEVRRFFCN